MTTPEDVLDNLTFLLSSLGGPGALISTDICDPETITYLVDIIKSNDMSDAESRSSVRDAILPFFHGICEEAYEATAESILEFFEGQAEALTQASEPLETPSARLASVISRATEDSRRPNSDIEEDGDFENLSTDGSEEKRETTESIEALCSMMPHLDRALVKYVLEIQCVGNCAEAGPVLVDLCSDPEALEAVEKDAADYMKRQQQQRQQEILTTQQVHRSIVAKFGEQEIRPQFDKKGNPVKPFKPLIFVRNENKNLRYLDDRVVSHKGEKTIVLHNPADDYDGGSRGKVKSKGKRGPGWV